VTVKRSRAVKIVIYKNIHAGANTHGGGVSAGFVSVVYQVKSSIIILCLI
jgi:hypothetical protein